MNKTSSAALKALLAGPTPGLAPGCYDALSATLIEQAGFSAAFLSGAAIAYTQLGRGDIGLVTASEVADQIAAICDRVSIPLVVDADTGFGNALNVQRTVKMFERMGAAALQLEDQVMPKRCGHLAGKTLVSTAEMVGKIKAALDSRHDALIVARTDAVAVEGFDRSLERAHAYAEAGADMIFVEAPPSVEHMRRLCAELGAKAPLMANMVEGGTTPVMSAAELGEIGYSFVIFPGAFVRALVFMGREFFASLKEHGTTQPYWGRMVDLKGINQLVGADEMLAAGRAYDPSIQSWGVEPSEA
jgi:2-methylisocitrate lyase-like PEP mutase family enzyme